MPEIEIPIDQFYTLKRSPVKGQCHVKGCTNRSAKGKYMLCKKHDVRIWRARNPARCKYAYLRDHARHRKIGFTITFDDFKRVIEGTDYLNAEASLHIDRINAARGYEPGNLRVIPMSENIAKGNKERRNLEYRIALLERLGYHEDADVLRSELDWLTGLDWVDPDSVRPSAARVTETCPF